MQLYANIVTIIVWYLLLSFLFFSVFPVLFSVIVELFFCLEFYSLYSVCKLTLFLDYSAAFVVLSRVFLLVLFAQLS